MMYRVQKPAVRCHKAGKARHWGKRRWWWWHEDSGRALQDIAHQGRALSLSLPRQLACRSQGVSYYCSLDVLAPASLLYCSGFPQPFNLEAVQRKYAQREAESDTDDQAKALKAGSPGRDCQIPGTLCGFLELFPRGVVVTPRD